MKVPYQLVRFRALQMQKFATCRPLAFPIGAFRESFLVAPRKTPIPIISTQSLHDQTSAPPRILQSLQALEKRLQASLLGANQGRSSGSYAGRTLCSRQCNARGPLSPLLKECAPDAVSFTRAAPMPRVRVGLRVSQGVMQASGGVINPVNARQCRSRVRQSEAQRHF